MILIFIECADALAIDDKALKRFIGFAVDELNWLVPNPESFGAGVNRGTDAKACGFFLFEQDSV